MEKDFTIDDLEIIEGALELQKLKYKTSLKLNKYENEAEFDDVMAWLEELIILEHKIKSILRR